MLTVNFLIYSYRKSDLIKNDNFINSNYWFILISFKIARVKTPIFDHKKKMLRRYLGMNKTNINRLLIYFICFGVNLVLKNSKLVKYYMPTLTIIVKEIWLNSEQTTKEVIKMPFMELQVQILPG